uniref:Uncharacterized protein n=1 Tax=Anguilla anguilla TaxID=7936 RepID=A0A0E9RD71_ANGAN
MRHCQQPRKRMLLTSVLGTQTLENGPRFHTVNIWAQRNSTAYSTPL